MATRTASTVSISAASLSPRDTMRKQTRVSRYEPVAAGRWRLRSTIDTAPTMAAGAAAHHAQDVCWRIRSHHHEGGRPLSKKMARHTSSAAHTTTTMPTRTIRKRMSS